MTNAFSKIAALLFAVVASACVASRGDVEVLQNDIRMVRAEFARDDSARAREMRRLSESMRAIGDSLSALSTRLGRMRAEFQGRLGELEGQVLRAQELAGQSQTRIQELRASLEQVSGASTPPRAPRTTGTQPAPAEEAGPGPNQLYQLGRDQFIRGSTQSARSAFQEVLNRYPESDVADDAQYYIGETHAAEGNAPAADSVYQIVVTRHPRSNFAPTALYKRATIAERAGRRTDARRLYSEVVARFPRSDEATLSRDRLEGLR